MAKDPTPGTTEWFHAFAAANQRRITDIKPMSFNYMAKAYMNSAGAGSSSITRSYDEANRYAENAGLFSGDPTYGAFARNYDATVGKSPNGGFGYGGAPGTQSVFYPSGAVAEGMKRNQTIWDQISALGKNTKRAVGSLVTSIADNLGRLEYTINGMHNVYLDRELAEGDGMSLGEHLKVEFRPWLDMFTFGAFADQEVRTAAQKGIKLEETITTDEIMRKEYPNFMKNASGLGRFTGTVLMAVGHDPLTWATFGGTSAARGIAAGGAKALGKDAYAKNLIGRTWYTSTGRQAGREEVISALRAKRLTKAAKSNNKAVRKGKITQEAADDSYKLIAEQTARDLSYDLKGFRLFTKAMANKPISSYMHYQSGLNKGSIAKAERELARVHLASIDEFKDTLRNNHEMLRVYHEHNRGSEFTYGRSGKSFKVAEDFEDFLDDFAHAAGPRLPITERSFRDLRLRRSKLQSQARDSSQFALTFQRDFERFVTTLGRLDPDAVIPPGTNPPSSGGGGGGGGGGGPRQPQPAGPAPAVRQEAPTPTPETPTPSATPEAPVTAPARGDQPVGIEEPVDLTNHPATIDSNVDEVFDRMIRSRQLRQASYDEVRSNISEEHLKLYDRLYGDNAESYIRSKVLERQAIIRLEEAGENYVVERRAVGRESDPYKYTKEVNAAVANEIVRTYKNLAMQITAQINAEDATRMITKYQSSANHLINSLLADAKHEVLRHLSETFGKSIPEITPLRADIRSDKLYGYARLRPDGTRETATVSEGMMQDRERLLDSLLDTWLTDGTSMGSPSSYSNPATHRIIPQGMTRQEAVQSVWGVDFNDPMFQREVGLSVVDTNTKVDASTLAGTGIDLDAAATKYLSKKEKEMLFSGHYTVVDDRNSVMPVDKKIPVGIDERRAILAKLKKKIKDSSGSKVERTVQVKNILIENNISAQEFADDVAGAMQDYMIGLDLDPDKYGYEFVRGQRNKINIIKKGTTEEDLAKLDGVMVIGGDVRPPRTVKVVTENGSNLTIENSEAVQAVTAALHRVSTDLGKAFEGLVKVLDQKNAARRSNSTLGAISHERITNTSLLDYWIHGHILNSEFKTAVEASGDTKAIGSFANIGNSPFSEQTLKVMEIFRREIVKLRAESNGADSNSVRAALALLFRDDYARSRNMREALENSLGAHAGLIRVPRKIQGSQFSSKDVYMQTIALFNSLWAGAEQNAQLFEAIHYGMMVEMFRKPWLNNAEIAKRIDSLTSHPNIAQLLTGAEDALRTQGIKVDAIKQQLRRDTMRREAPERPAINPEIAEAPPEPLHADLEMAASPASAESRAVEQSSIEGVSVPALRKMFDPADGEAGTFITLPRTAGSRQRVKAFVKGGIRYANDAEGNKFTDAISGELIKIPAGRNKEGFMREFYALYGPNAQIDMKKHLRKVLEANGQKEADIKSYLSDPDNWIKFEDRYTKLLDDARAYKKAYDELEAPARPTIPTARPRQPEAPAEAAPAEAAPVRTAIGVEEPQEQLGLFDIPNNDAVLRNASASQTGRMPTPASVTREAAQAGQPIAADAVSTVEQLHRITVTAENQKLIHDSMKEMSDRLMGEILEFQMKLEQDLSKYQLKMGGTVRIFGSPTISTGYFMNPLQEYGGVAAMNERRGSVANWVTKVLQENPGRLDFINKFRRPSSFNDAMLNEMRKTSSNLVYGSLILIHQNIDDTWRKIMGRTNRAKVTRQFFSRGVEVPKELAQTDARFKDLNVYVTFGQDLGTPEGVRAAIDRALAMNKLMPKKYRIPDDVFKKTDISKVYTREWFIEAAAYMQDKNLIKNSFAGGRLQMIDLPRLEYSLQHARAKLVAREDTITSFLDAFSIQVTKFKETIDIETPNGSHSVIRDTREKELIDAMNEKLPEGRKYVPVTGKVINKEQIPIHMRLPGGDYFIREDYVEDIKKIMGFMHDVEARDKRILERNLFIEIENHWKAMVTTFNIPKFHVVNTMSDVFLGALDGLVNPKYYKKSFTIMRNSHPASRKIQKNPQHYVGIMENASDTGDAPNISRFEDLGTRRNREPNIKVQGEGEASPTISTVWTNDGVVNITSDMFQNAYVARGAGQTQISNIVTTGSPAFRSNKGSQAGMWIYDKAQDWSNIREDSMRMAHFVYAVEDIAKRGNYTLDEIFDMAVERVIKYHFDYADVSAFEERRLKYLMPFYKWVRNITPLTIGLFFTNPKAFTIPQHINQAASQQLMPQQYDAEGNAIPFDAVLPQYLAQNIYMPIGSYVDPNGNTLGRYAALNLPLTQTVSNVIEPLVLPMFDGELTTVETAKQMMSNVTKTGLGMTGPWIKIIQGLATGKTFGPGGSEFPADNPIGDLLGQMVPLWGLGQTQKRVEKKGVPNDLITILKDYTGVLAGGDVTEGAQKYTLMEEQARLSRIKKNTAAEWQEQYGQGDPTGEYYKEYLRQRGFNTR